jgi:hypothetical protein
MLSCQLRSDNLVKVFYANITVNTMYWNQTQNLEKFPKLEVIYALLERCPYKIIVIKEFGNHNILFHFHLSFPSFVRIIDVF